MEMLVSGILGHVEGTSMEHILMPFYRKDSFPYLGAIIRWVALPPVSGDVPESGTGERSERQWRRKRAIPAGSG